MVEIISDSGEGAQRCGQALGAIAARMGNGVWTVEIIPAEIRPPARSVAGASGNRIRLGARRVTNGGDETDLVIAFNEQVLLGRVRAGELKHGCTILLESMWRDNPDPAIAGAYVGDATTSWSAAGLPGATKSRWSASAARWSPTRAAARTCSRWACCAASTASTCSSRATRSRSRSARRPPRSIETNVMLLEAGYAWAEANLDFKYRIPAVRATEPQIVVNGNTALALGVLASGMEICAMYPITPATSASHYLCDVFEKVGGVVHQAEDEIAACAFAIGASYAGKCAVTITSGPGYSLKQEAIGLAVMAEIPLVVVNVQRGGPSTGQPTKAEQGDLLTAIFGSHGDAPKVVMAASHHRGLLLLGHHRAQDRRDVQHGRRGADRRQPRHLAAAVPAAEVRRRPGWRRRSTRARYRAGAKPYDWDPDTGLARRFIPGQPGGMHTVTGLAHDRASHVAYDPEINEESLRARSLKLAALQKTLKAPPVFGDAEGDLLVIGWGSTKGAIEEAVERLRAEGCKVSSMHLRFLQPMAPGIKEAMSRLQAR